MQQLVVDVILAVGFAFISAPFMLDLDLIDLLLLVLFPGALAIRRFSPVLSLSVAWVAAVLQMVALRQPTFVDLAVLPILFTIASYGGKAARRYGLVSALVGGVVVTLYTMVLPLFIAGTSTIGSPQFGFELFGSRIGAAIIPILIILVGSTGLFVLSWTFGLLARTARLARESRIAKQVAERAVVIEQERNQLARDMHDVVAHSLAVVIAQADGARYTKDPIASADALATISATARAALTDVRLLLGQLRHSQESGPQPRLADLDRLIQQVRDAGLTISLDELGQRPQLPASQSLAVYRILQEALTNALRHGDTAKPVEIRLDWATDAVALEVSNALRSAEPGEPNHGLTGMQERATLVGGEFSAGVEHDRFIVRATIPLPAVEPVDAAPPEPAP